MNKFETQGRRVIEAAEGSSPFRVVVPEDSFFATFNRDQALAKLSDPAPYNFTAESGCGVLLRLQSVRPMDPSHAIIVFLRGNRREERRKFFNPDEISTVDVPTLYIYSKTRRLLREVDSPDFLTSHRIRERPEIDIPDRIEPGEFANFSFLLPMSHSRPGTIELTTRGREIYFSVTPASVE